MLVGMSYDIRSISLKIHSYLVYDIIYHLDIEPYLSQQYLPDKPHSEFATDPTIS